MWSHLDEPIRRLTAANEVMSLGFGGIALVRRAKGDAPSGPAQILHRSQGQQRAAKAPEPEAEEISWRMELRHQSDRNMVVTVTY